MMSYFKHSIQLFLVQDWAKGNLYTTENQDMWSEFACVLYKHITMHAKEAMFFSLFKITYIMPQAYSPPPNLKGENQFLMSVISQRRPH